MMMMMTMTMTDDDDAAGDDSDDDDDAGLVQDFMRLWTAMADDYDNVDFFQCAGVRSDWPKGLRSLLGRTCGRDLLR